MSWKAITAIAASVLGLMWLFAKRRPMWAPTVHFPTRDWHPCSICAYDDALIRPHELMCAKHWVMVPVLLRNWLRDNRRERGPQSEAWLAQAERAIDFVEDSFVNQARVRRMKPGAAVPETT